ncbi:MAG: phosphate transporter substrate-binding protein PhoT family [Bacillales bacterium]|jgi:phosphate transport system substrate-binding protein|nr:phosphate transporter substrate-binding protein PhoT family [Bacillales bacterium]
MKTSAIKKSVILGLISILVLTLFTGCGKESEKKEAVSYKDKEISVVSREDGSGARGAFIELFGVEVKNADGSKKDMTTKNAIIGNKANIILTNVAQDEYAIGYVSLDSVNDDVKALKIDGAEPTIENVKKNTYTAHRPFNVVTKGAATGLKKDFIDFILSTDGQAVVEKTQVSINDQTAPYAGSKPSGKIVVAGSSSVSPLMEKLIEAYKIINPNAKVELQTTDSTAGIQAALNGTADIGMASRKLKDEESAKVVNTQIATDCMAIIVNKNNPISDISKDEVRKIFIGETTKWNVEK